MKAMLAALLAGGLGHGCDAVARDSPEPSEEMAAHLRACLPSADAADEAIIAGCEALLRAEGITPQQRHLYSANLAKAVIRTDPARAYALALSILREQPESVTTLTLAAQAAFATEDMEAATRYADAAIELAPLALDARELRVAIHVTRGAYEEALFESDFILANLRQADVAADVRRTSDAVRYGRYEAYGYLFERDMPAPAHMLRAIIQHARGDIAASRAEAERARAIGDEAFLDPSAKLRAWCLSASQRSPVAYARATCEAALAFDADPWTRVSLARVALRDGRFDEAESIYSAALAEAPETEAAQLTERGFELQALRTQALFGRGLARRRQGEISGGNADIVAAIGRGGNVQQLFDDFTPF